MKVKLNLFNGSGRTSSKKPEPNYLKTLEDKYFLEIKKIPIYNWNGVFKDHDFSLALLDKKDQLDERAQDAILRLQESYIDAFGVDEKEIEFARARISIALLEIDMILEDDKSLQNRIIVLESELERDFKSNEKGSFQQAVMAVEIFRKFPVDQHTMTAFEFFSYINLMKQHEEQRLRKKTEQA